MRRADDGFSVSDTDQRAESESALIFHAPGGLARPVSNCQDFLTSNCAVRAVSILDEVAAIHGLATHIVCHLECGLLEVARRERAEPVEYSNVRHCAGSPVLLGGRPQTSDRQVATDFIEPFGIENRRWVTTSHCDGLEVLRPHHGARPCPTSLTSTVVCDARVPHPALARGAYAGNPEPAS